MDDAEDDQNENEENVQNLNEDEGEFEDRVLFIFNEDELQDGREAEDEGYVEDISDLSKQAKSQDVVFDRSLPGSHSYLGHNMQELKGRTIHESGETMLLPLFYLPGVVLVPGQTLPLNLFHPQPISMMKRVLEADKTFGLLMAKSQEAFNSELAEIGITCEIFSVREVEEYGVTTMSLIAAGRQRFQIISKNVQIDGVIMGKIRILPELVIDGIPKGVLLCSSQNHANFLTSELLKVNNSRVMKLDLKTCSTSKAFSQNLSAFPWWVYKLYNPHLLMDRLIDDIKSWNENLDFSTVPSEPAEFSHWVTANLPLTNEMKVHLLQVDTAVVRLQKLLEIMKSCSSSLACKSCDAIIASKNDLFSMSSTGLQAAYVNPGGVVHETLTFLKADGLHLQGRSSTEYSWFPGYAWTIACCENCGEHIGWRYTAVRKELKPNVFWGLTRASLVPVFNKEAGKDIDVLNSTAQADIDPDTINNRDTNIVQYESSI